MNWMPRGLAGAAFAVAVGVSTSSPGFADEAAAKLAAAHLYAGTLAAGEEELAAILAKDSANGEARLGLATVKFVRAVEKLSQGLYRFGLQPPQNSFMLPVVRLPVPVNPDPQPITYADFRALIQGFVDDASAVDGLLAGLGPGEVKLPLDLRQIRYDVNGDGKAEDDERFLAVVGRVTGVGPDAMPSSLEFAFDRGDAIWLRGYCNVMIAVGDFFLAHDWHESFEYTFHIFFPKSDLPFTRALDAAGPDDFTNIADLISFLHVRWPVTDPALLSASREAFKEAIALSRESWDAIEAETDNGREWLPNPRQTGRFAGYVVTGERIKAWHAVLDETELMLDGRKLVPHWRFKQGFNLRRVFEEPRPFDLVLWITGPAALPYLEDGPIETRENWNQLVAAFDNAFSVYMAWFN